MFVRVPGEGSVRYRRLLSIVVASVTVVTGTGVASAQDRTDAIQQRLDEIERLRTQLSVEQRSVEGDIAKDAARRDVLTTELTELQALANSAQHRVDIAANDLETLQRQIDAKDAAIANAGAELAQRKDSLRRRAVDVYKHGPSSFFDLLVDIRGLPDFLRRVGLVSKLMSDEDRNIAEIARVRTLVVRDRNDAAKLRDAAAAQVAVVAQERDQAASVANTAASRRDAVIGELESSYAKLGDIARQRGEYERETAELQSESAAISEFLKGHGDGPAQVSPKGMIWPVNGPITSGFGWREHPIFHDQRFHTGIDIGVPQGTPIKAAGSGVVLFAGVKNGYGNTLIIDHGGGIATLYAHQSALGASVGQPVTRGQIVGSTGCTGYCTGPHLHFEVRVNGEPVDPMGWLP